MTIHQLNTENSILNRFLFEIRSKSIQQDAMRFRRNIERIGEILGYELSKALHYSETVVETPLGRKKIQLIDNEIVLCSVLRAGLPLHQGLQNYFDQVENAYVSAYRKHQANDDTKFEIKVEYLASPSLDDKTLILADPMLATGHSLGAVLEALKTHGIPKEIHIVCVIAATNGIDFIKDKFPKNTHLWIAAIDDTLNEKGYIIPGLGDAGDLAFGPKLS